MTIPAEGTTYRIRFHGRGGQGMKTASRILGAALFLEGFEVQDAPRYGAERRGAPIFAYVRAARQTIHERGVIANPDLVVVADETLVPMPAAAVLQGVGAQTLVLIRSRERAQLWQDRLKLAGPLFVLPAAEEGRGRLEPGHIGTACAAAAARLLGVVSWSSLAKALGEELGELGEAVVEANLVRARRAYDQMEPHQGRVAPGPAVAAEGFTRPAWVALDFEAARLSAPAIHAASTSGQVQTGLWRTLRPVIDGERCTACGLCSIFCPEGAIAADEAGAPRIDYAHCKGCMVCAAQCPHRAIEAIPEQDARQTDREGEAK